MNKTRRAWVFIVILIGAVLGYQKLGRMPGRPSGQMAPLGPPAPSPSATVLPIEMAQAAEAQVIAVQEGEVRKTLRAAGRVAMDERKVAHVNPRVEGWIQTLFVNFTGQPVKKGAPLLTLYAPDLLAAQEEYLLARRGQETFLKSEIPEVRITGEVIVSAARKKLLLWGIPEAQVQALEERGAPSAEITLYAPSDGVVLQKQAAQGMHVMPQMTLYEIADLTTVWVYADVYESDLADIKKGQGATVSVIAYPERVFHGTVAFIDPVVSPENRTVRVRVQLDNPDRLLKPGMLAQVTWSSVLGSGVVIPESAVLDSGAGQSVFVDAGMGKMGMYERRAIQARRVEDRYWVKAGLAAGEKIATSANFLLDSESKLMASAHMMGELGMGGITMEQAQMGEMGEMADMAGMPGMENMPGMKMEDMAGMNMDEKPAAVVAQAPASVGAQTRKVGDLTWTLSSDPSPPRDGKNRLRLILTDAAGVVVEGATVTFAYTMPMPGMRAVTVPASPTPPYEAQVKFGMPGTWNVTVSVTLPGRPALQETFPLEVVAPPPDAITP